MKYLNFEKAKDRCFALMYSIGCDEYIDDVESATKIDDLVNLCKQVLRTFLDDDHSNGIDRNDSDPEVRKLWKSNVGKLKRYINTYSRFIQFTRIGGRQ